MSKQECDLLARFDEYFNELEGYGLRSERFYDDMKYAKTAHCKNRDELLKYWLRAAYLMGARQMATETLDVLGDWGTAMAGVREPLCNPTEKFDEVAAELELFYRDTFTEIEEVLNEAD